MARVGRLIVALGIALGACEHDSSDEGDSGDDVLAGVEVTLSEALAIARAAVPDGIALEGELSLGDEPVYDVDLLDDGEVREAFIDAKTGEVMDILTDPEDLAEAELIAAALADAEVSLDDAIVIAEEAGDGIAVAIDLDGDIELYRIVVIRDNDAILVTVELATGAPVVDDTPPEDD